MAATEFTLNIPDAAITDLCDRLGRTRFPDQAPGEPWAYGTSVNYLRELVEYWRSSFDWRTEEAQLNAFPQFKVPLPRLQRLYQMRSLRMLDTTKKSGVIRL